jgi:hypothetical protein
MINFLLKYIRLFLFGKPVTGEALQAPSYQTFHPQISLPENEWYQEMKFGSRYGHKGSFYQSR